MAGIADLNRLWRPTRRNASRTPCKRTGLNFGPQVVGGDLDLPIPAPLANCRWEPKGRRMTPPSNFALPITVEGDSRLVRTRTVSMPTLPKTAGWMRSDGTRCSTPWDYTLLNGDGPAPAAWMPLGSF